MSEVQNMRTIFLKIVLLTIASTLICSAIFSQERQGTYSLPKDQIIPGKPWTEFIPDPDKFDWNGNSEGRPGYRFRGMLPIQQKFYDYIKEKQRVKAPLSSAEEATIRWLISSRRWPEMPRPNPFWRAFMRYLREQPTKDLNVAQSIMLTQLQQRGLVPVDFPPDANLLKIRDYLNSGPFRARNLFEWFVGRVEPWMDNLYAGAGIDMRPSDTSSSTTTSFPVDGPFNGLRINYNVKGATLYEPIDREGYTFRRSIKGDLGSGALAISGTVRVGGYGADVTISVWAGDKKEEKKFYLENIGKDGNPQAFNLSVPIPAGARTGGFAIRLDGRYSMGGGSRACYVTGDFGPSKAEVDAEREAADAKWRQEVEDTLRRLGYENTPEGKELEEMRKALAGGDATWKAFVADRLDRMKGDNSPQIVEYKELENAIEKGGSAWEEYVATHGPTLRPTPVAIKDQSKFVGKLLSGQLITGEVQELTGPRRNRTWPLTIRITKYDAPTGAIEGELAWSTLQSVNRIRGSLSGRTLEFTETEAIKAGNAHLNVSYKLTFSDDGASGAYTDQGDNSQGSIKLTASPEVESERFVDKLLKGELISGEAQETEGPRNNRTWSFTIRITNYDAATGNVVGEITWPTLNSVHRIRGKLFGSTLEFVETEAIKAGRAYLNVSYKLSLSDGSASGTYFDPKEKTRGSVRMPVPPSK